MNNLNSCHLQGNLVADPELKETKNPEKPVVRFTVAVNHGFGDKEEAAFIPCVAFGKQAAVIAKYFSKGRPIIVNGLLVQNRWKTDEGESRSRLEVRLNTFEGFHFIGGGKGQEGQQEQEQEVEATQEATTEPTVEPAQAPVEGLF